MRFYRDIEKILAQKRRGQYLEWPQLSKIGGHGPGAPPPYSYPPGHMTNVAYDIRLSEGSRAWGPAVEIRVSNVT